MPATRPYSLRHVLFSALCAAALAMSAAAAHARSGPGPASGPSPAPSAAPPKVEPVAAPSKSEPSDAPAAPSKVAPASSKVEPTSAPQIAPTAEPTPDDLGADEPSAEDPALEDDPAEEQQKSPQTEQDYAFSSVASKQARGEMSTTAIATINYETSAATAAPAPCERTVRAHVVALDQVFFWNRLGAVQPQGMIFALRHHVVPTDGGRTLRPGRVRLRADKRPRPLVLRMNVGDCLQIDFQNLLAPEPRDEQQPATRTASVHVAGLQLVHSIRDDGSNVGNNQPPPNGLVRPGERITYTLYADRKMREGSHILFSAAATTTGEGDGGQIPPGLFGAVNVEPRTAEWYRSQLSHNDLLLAAKRDAYGNILRTKAGQPLINYKAVYPWWHRYRFQPILKMMNAKNVIVHSDLTAIITGPDRGKFPAGTYPPVAVSPNRDWPFREFTIIYHDEIGAVQAFPQFERQGPGQLADTLHASRDAFAINYGSGGIGAEILANRIGVGPMAECDECLFEEFFLSSWAVGDPAMVVDRPANSLRGPEVPPCRIGSTLDTEKTGLRDGVCNEERKDVPPGYKATRAFYPHDPSNVYHSYLNDHTKMRVLHAGPKEHHIHHLHAHQWLKSADGDSSSYNDSQAVGPGSSVNLEIAYGGGGNRNLTPGDAIFHCHFYPHFAQGMWALWRVHDVFEEGTPLDFAGRPRRGTRALPDAEIKRGTPIPALVPLPGGTAADKADYVMAPVPEVAVSINEQTGQAVIPEGGNPGFPFFVPGIMGRRAPHPPLDLAFDAGLPRHIIREAEVAFHKEERLSFNKELGPITEAKQLDEAGEPVELAAMKFHSFDFHDSYRTDNSPGPFMTNGLDPAPGAPYADPCVNPRWDVNGKQILTAEKFGRDITYKGVMFQFDMKLNKAGWHFPQSRIESLWEDWKPTIQGDKPPEPLFFRANTDDCVTFEHANLIPRIYRVDDFQVETPTDIVGQHIHLVKFDVTSSDGAGNGWNYEDGTFGDEEVAHRIELINKGGGIINLKNEREKLEPKGHPSFDNRPTQVTYQRWLVDNVLSLPGAADTAKLVDRTLRNAFTHDHFGPSTHQQTGLYAGLVIEPKGSDWYDNEQGENLRLGIGSGTEPPRKDGGPTSWAAIIVPPNKEEAYREFMIEFADFQLAYLKDRGFGEDGLPAPDPEGAINPPGRREVRLNPNPPPIGGPFGFDTRLVEKPIRQGCPNGDRPPCPEILSAEDVGTFSVNYRNEPIALRVRNPATNTQAAGDQGDLSLAYKSIHRADFRLNTFGPYPPLTPGIGLHDPYTPLLRANEKDRVQVRILVGAHEEGHNFTVHGVKWFFEPFDPDSGYRNSQMMGISEKYDFILPGLPPDIGNPEPGEIPKADYLYKPGAAVDDQWNGLWGILRSYTLDSTARASRMQLVGGQTDAPPAVLPNNAETTSDTTALSTAETETDAERDRTCPVGAPLKQFEVRAYLARDILPGSRLVFTGQNYHNFTVRDEETGQTETGPLHDPTAILYVRSEHIGPDGKYNRQRVEPLLLRANAGDCIQVTLRNFLPDIPFDLPGYNTLPMIVDDFNANQVVPSRRVGLHPQLVHYDVRRSDGMNVGRNPIQTASPGGSVTYRWYAGDVGIELTTGAFTYTPVEFGATNLTSSDPIKHSNKSAIGSLIIEPMGYDWVETDSTHEAYVYARRRCLACTHPQEFREFVLQFQNDLNLRFGDGSPVPNTAEAEDAEDSGQKAINYRTEPMWTRLCYWPALPLGEGPNWPPATQCPQFSNAESTRQLDMTNSLHNIQIGNRDPVTPIFTAGAGDPVRFRVLHSNGHARNNVFMVHGHIWQEMPYATGTRSTSLGFNAKSPWHGAQWGHGPSNHFDVLIERAGGAFNIGGDYLYRTFQSFQFDGGIWGLFRVSGRLSDEGTQCLSCSQQEIPAAPPQK